MATPYVEHVAIRTRNFEWYLDFFQNVMGMEITLTDPEEGGEHLNQAWVGGIQLQRDESYDPEAATVGQMSHFGLVAENVDALLERVYAVEGVIQAEGKPRNWFRLPDGPVIEVNEA